MTIQAEERLRLLFRLAGASDQLARPVERVYLRRDAFWLLVFGNKTKRMSSELTLRDRFKQLRLS